MELRQPAASKKIKVDAGKSKRALPKKKAPKGTTTGHYLKFIEKNLHRLDKNPSMKNFYIVINNALSHSLDEIGNLITVRGYRYIYVFPYSPELKPIEKFWSVVKNSVRRSRFKEAEVCNNVPVSHFRVFIKYSVR